MICRRDIGWLHLGNFHDRYVTDKRLYELVRNFGLRLLASFLQRFFPSTRIACHEGIDQSWLDRINRDLMFTQLERNRFH